MTSAQNYVNANKYSPLANTTLPVQMNRPAFYNTRKLVRKVRGMSSADLDLWKDFKVDNLNEDDFGFHVVKNFQDEQFIDNTYLRRAKR